MSSPYAGPRHTGAVQLAPGSWGANGDFSMWIGPKTLWTWQRLWPLEERFWAVAAAALADPAQHAVLAQATRSLLLLQSSDWQFIISTGEVADYAERRFIEHAEDTSRLIAALEGAPGVDLDGTRAFAETLRARDDVFPGVLDGLRVALAGSAQAGTAG